MKVTVTKEVAKAFEYLKEIRNYTSDNDLLSEHAEAITTKDWYDNLQPLNKVDLMTFAKMLINGYEVEATAEESILKYFNTTSWKQERDAVVFVLNTLKVKIPGVNDIA
ncbi:hypothetical protein [Ureibacillus sinduriensis]|uniref:Uncharacterized protein n=1 Tax=Ureibacillus sinduriensis BLB-1 = JCM 15800 TaxID=1384057 RepID=A0A0A3HR64_9BACL|nr:hypothetical protein [Ureibacillus sinduriensis]KGR74869.1 hypothetical protein CD33_13970 [Ureibacillus sinduriensis BLB-1 = JCM 15800]